MNASSPPWLIQRSGRRSDVLLLCDHAGNEIPAQLNALGLDEDQRQRHIAWDPGALEVATCMAERLDAGLLGWRLSRLVADPNRAPDHADLILARSDDTFVPGNETLSLAERAARISEFHAPYHQAIDAAVNQRLAAGIRPLLISIHSFEPEMVGIKRPWPIGVLWKASREPVAGVIQALADMGLNVGDNQPYDGHVALGYTLEHHAIRPGLPHILFEVRNDMISSADQAQHWANCAIEALESGGMLRPNR